MNHTKVALYTLGCKLNYAETSAIGRRLEAEGYETVDFEDTADVYVINTCSVTENADKKCRDIIRRALRRSPAAKVAVVGCYAQLQPREIAAIEGVDLVLGAAEKFKLAQHLQPILHSPKAAVGEWVSCAIDEVDTFESSYSAGERTRAFLKVQDGCDYSCSFCTIPLARGSSRSDRIANIVQSAEEIATLGIKEIVLTGVNIGDFGKSAAIGGREERFLELIQTLDKVEGIERFRISSIEPNLLSNDIIQFVAASQRFVPHFHIPLQSGNNRLLGLMRRRYRRELYAERVAAIKNALPQACIGVDVIVGFPSESEDDFLDTYHFLHHLDISYLHVFTYSEREQTKALDLSPVVPMQERYRRNKMLRILSEKKRHFFYEQHIGKSYTVLWEHEMQEDGTMQGFTENYIKVSAPYQAACVNTLQRVQLAHWQDDGTIAAILV
ncbi:MAG: tRNA (N(6)-L-threonylcarbamoyladenosine(37)-C(2))-methylthiotransferase MtaB [Sphingobacteriales bacterium]|nr:tRNA (N(6)-L-threonylcarbamoyladenosine(37)-C(2))-methylthiotransferase MtaB [Sphingobacteriales bacterium]